MFGRPYKFQDAFVHKQLMFHLVPEAFKFIGAEQEEKKKWYMAIPFPFSLPHQPLVSKDN